MLFSDPSSGGSEASRAMLVLHTLRILGSASADRAAAIFGLDPEWVAEHLLDSEAVGLVRRTRWDGSELWSLTERGKAANESSLKSECAAAGAVSLVEWALETFESVNGRFTAACTAWQLDERPPGAGVPASLLQELSYCGARLAEVTSQLSTRLARFGVHQRRYDLALDQVRAGHSSWIDSPALPSLHLVWMGVHEDLLATLGRNRG